MEVKRLVCGSFATNTYLLSIDDQLLIVDPACKYEKLIPYLDGKKVLAVLLTHGHFDHIKTCDDLYNKHHVPVYLNMEDENLTNDSRQGREFGYDSVPTIYVPLTGLKEGMMKIGPFEFEVIFTPGHTLGSVCFKFENCIFTGDTLFRCSVGRTDLKGGNSSTLKNSLKIFKEMDRDLLVYPGHEFSSTIGFELDNNPYL